MSGSLTFGLKREHIIMKFLQSFTFREGLDVLELSRKLDVARNKAQAQVEKLRKFSEEIKSEC
jgi:hypothetical protein